MSQWKYKRPWMRVKETLQLQLMFWFQIFCSFNKKKKINKYMRFTKRLLRLKIKRPYLFLRYTKRDGNQWLNILKSLEKDNYVLLNFAKGRISNELIHVYQTENSHTHINYIYKHTEQLVILFLTKIHKHFMILFRSTLILMHLYIIKSISILKLRRTF